MPVLRSVSAPHVGRRGGGVWSTYLAGLLLEERKFLDGGMNVCLFLRGPVSTVQAQPGRYIEGTFASVSASGICLSTSLEKSFSGLNAASAIARASMLALPEIWGCTARYESSKIEGGIEAW